MNKLQAIAESLKEGKSDKVKEFTQAALDEGVNADDVLDNGLIAGMAVVGKLFRGSEMFLPEVMMSAKAMDAGMTVLEPILLSSGNYKGKGKVALGTVKGDVHTIGKNLVGICLKGAGFEVIDLGIDVSIEKFVEVAKNGVQIIGMSAMLTTTMQQMKPVIDALAEAGLKGKVKTMIGGCIATQEYADCIGADGYAPDAGSAVDKVKELMGK